MLKKETRGRKKGEDNKVTCWFFPRQSRVKRLGGKKKLQQMVDNFVEQTYKDLK